MLCVLVEDGRACQAGTTADPNLLPKVRRYLTGPSPSFDGEFVRTAAGGYIVHLSISITAFRNGT